jgi:hypothetical protein
MYRKDRHWQSLTYRMVGQLIVTHLTDAAYERGVSTSKTFDPAYDVMGCLGVHDMVRNP